MIFALMLSEGPNTPNGGDAVARRLSLGAVACVFFWVPWLAPSFSGELPIWKIARGIGIFSLNCQNYRIVRLGRIASVG